LTCNDCAIIYGDDVDFGNVNFVEPSLFNAEQCPWLPSQVIDRNMLAHLKIDRQQQLLNLLDEYAACFSETPGLCTLNRYYICHNTKHLTLNSSNLPQKPITSALTQLPEFCRVSATPAETRQAH
jgi:hypothetical protein